MPIAKLTVEIEAQLAGLQAGLSKAQHLNEKAFAQIEARWAEIGAVGRNLGAALAGAFSVGVLAKFTTATIDALDALNDAKDATGATIENLSALEDVARRNGGTLDDVTGILVKFNGVLKEADGKNGVSQALKAIGLDAEKLRQLDPGEALRQAAVALNGFADDGNKARLVQELFGKSVREAAPFLKDLAESGRLNATATKEQTEQAERFNKQLAAMKVNAGNLGKTLITDLLPSLNKLLEALDKLPQKFGDKYALGNAQISSRKLQEETDRLISLQEMATNGPEATRGSFARRVEEQREVVARLTREAAAANEQLKELIGVRTKADYSNEGRNSTAPPKTLPDLFKPLAAAKAPDLTLPTDLQDMLKRLESTDVAKIQRLNDELALIQSLLIQGSQDPRLAEAFRATRKELEALQAAAADPNLGSSLEELSRRAAMQGQQQRNADAIADVNAALAATPTAQIKQLEALQEALQTRGDVDPMEKADAIKAIGEQLDLLKNKGVDAAAELQQTLGAQLKMALKGDFEGILAAWEEMIFEMIAKGAAAEIMKRVFGKGDGATGVTGEFFKFLLGSAKGNAFDGSGVIPFANGGVVNSATLFGFGGGRAGVMGEAGPEAILPLARGRNGKLGVQGGGYIDASIGTIIVGEGVSEARMRAVVQQEQRAQELRLMRLRREGRF